MKIKHFIIRGLLAMTLSIATISFGNAHPDKGQERPQTYAEAFIPITLDELKMEPKFRHSPGNVRAEDMMELIGDRITVIDQGRKFNYRGTLSRALKVVVSTKSGRDIACGYGDNGKYALDETNWAPIKFKHDGMLWHRLDPDIDNDNKQGASILYDGATGQIVFFAPRGKNWITWHLGHLQERLPRAVWTLCPDFPSAEELGVEVNEAQTAVTYDKLIAQDPGRRVLRPDLITPDPTEVIK